MKRPNLILQLSLVVIVSILLFSVFKNIQYGLLWGDEAETAVFAQRVLVYGYPKVHDGKNPMNMTMVPDRSVGVKESIDAWIHLPWMQYYYATIGEYLAQKTDDLYLKTLFHRIPFAAIGVLGIFVYGISLSKIFKKKSDKQVFLVAYLLLIVTSVSLALHLKEVRSYSLTIFLNSLLTFVFIDYYFLNKLKYIPYLFLTTLLLILHFNNYPPAFVIWLLAVPTYVFIEHILLKQKLNRKVLYPFLLGTLLTIPFLNFYETIQISLANSKHFQSDLGDFLEKLVRSIKYFTFFGFLPVGVIAKLLLTVMYVEKLRKKMVSSENKKIFSLGIFLTIFFVCHILIIANLPYLFDRYLVTLIPVLFAMISIDIILFIKLSTRLKNNNNTLIYSFVFIILFIINSATKIDEIRGHIYELFHPYFGPTDAVIFYIKENIPNPQNLVIETNIDENSYVYYLNSFVIREYQNNEKAVVVPDIVIPRNLYWDENYKIRSEKIMKQGQYEKITLKIADYPLNNIPEFSLSLNHLSKTRYSDSNFLPVVIFKKR